MASLDGVLTVNTEGLSQLVKANSRMIIAAMIMANLVVSFDNYHEAAEYSVSAADCLLRKLEDTQ